MSQRESGGSQRPAAQQQQSQKQRDEGANKRARGAGRRSPGSGGAQAQEVLPVHRMALLQALMSRSYMKEADCKKLLRQLCSNVDDHTYTSTITSISRELRFAHLAVLSVRSPVDNVKYVGLVNQLADESAKVATHYSIPHRDFFRGAMEAIAVSSFLLPEGEGAPCLSEMELLNLDPVAAAAAAPAPDTQGGGSQAAAAGSKKLTKAEKQELLHKLVADGWLAAPANPPGHYSIGPRTFLELKDYLKSLDLPDSTRAAWDQVM